MVAPMSLSIIAAGASGFVVEVHNDPDKAFSDGPQSLYPQQFDKLMKDVEALCPVVGKSLVRIPRTRIVSPDTSAPLSLQSDELVVAFQGEKGAYSEQAVQHVFDAEVKTLACHLFKDAFEAVMTRKARYAVLPVENTLGGTVNEVLDLLNVYPDLTVVGERQIRIRHNLIGLQEATLEGVKRVFSHPQELHSAVSSSQRRFPLLKRYHFSIRLVP